MAVAVHSNVGALSTALEPYAATHLSLPRFTSLWADWKYWRELRDRDVLLINTDISRTLLFCVRALLSTKAVHIVALDPVLPTPRTVLAKSFALLKKLLLRRVNLFIVFQRDLMGYGRWYGITPSRSVTIRFKINSWEQLDSLRRQVSDDGTFVAAGRTNRDLPTFAAAATLAGIRGVMLRQSTEVVSQHGLLDVGSAQFGNLETEIDGGTQTSFQARLLRSRAIVIPIASDVVNCAGISTALDAMAWGKPVIISDSPATRSIIPDDVAVIVSAGDINALCDGMLKIDSDEAFRVSLANRAMRFSESFGGERRLMESVAESLLNASLVSL